MGIKFEEAADKAKKIYEEKLERIKRNQEQIFLKGAFYNLEVMIDSKFRTLCETSLFDPNKHTISVNLNDVCDEGYNNRPNTPLKGEEIACLLRDTEGVCFKRVQEKYPGWKITITSLDTICLSAPTTPIVTRPQPYDSFDRLG